MDADHSAEAGASSPQMCRVLTLHCWIVRSCWEGDAGVGVGGGEFPGNEPHKTSNNQYSLTNEYQLNISAPNKAYEGI